MPYSSPACLWLSCPVTRATTSHPAAAYRVWPSVWVISSCQTSAIFQKFISGRVGVEYPKPGNDGTITSKASAGPRHRIVQAFPAYRAGLADRLGLALPYLPPPLTPPFPPQQR